MIIRLVRKAVLGALGTWAWRQGRQWWDEREGKASYTGGRTSTTRSR